MKKANHGVLRRFLFAMLALLLGLSFGLSAACARGGEDIGGNTGTGGETQPVAQSEEKDSETMTYTALGETKITDPYAVNGLEKEIAYLLKLDADRLLAGFYQNSALGGNGAQMYGGGWEGELIGGHTAGHYLSALAQAAANAGTPESSRAQLQTKLAYLVAELAKCQNNPDPTAEAGFLWGAARKGNANAEFQFDNVEAGKTADIFADAWVPWYTMHKILAGLLDAYALASSAQALGVAKKLGDWVCDRVAAWSEETRARVLAVEYGGMNDALYNLYAATGEEKYADAAHKFDEETLFALIDAEGDNYLDGRHANTTIPKIIGALNRYVTLHGKTLHGEKTDASYYLNVAEKFWTRVIERHTYVTGGNSEWEHFGADNVLDAERTNCNCETCNTYNMLKLSRMLFTVTKNTKYLDYYENTYYNAIWSSQNPETGMTTYFQPMASGYFKVYSSEEEHFWCCTGSGMESFTKLNDSIYYDAGNATYAALYLASAYKSEKVSLTMQADLEHSDEVTVSVSAGETVLRLRKPAWTAAFAVTVNGRAVAGEAAGGFVSVFVKAGDTVRVRLQKTVTAHGLPDNANVYAFRYGPFALSAQLGSENMNTGTTGVNVTIPAAAAETEQQEIAEEGVSVAAFMQNIGSYLVKNEDGTFTLTGTTAREPLVFSYHFRQHTQRYALYNEFVPRGEKAVLAPAFEWARTDTVQPGYGQYEADELHSMRESGSVAAQNVPVLGTTRYAAAGGSFTYTVAVEPAAQNRLVVYFAKEDNGKPLRILAGGVVLFESDALAYTGEGQMYAAELAIPAAAKTYTKTANGRAYTVLDVTVEGAENADSARLCSYLYSEALVNHQAYFVDCGDYTPATAGEGEVFGAYNSVTEQVYGADPQTGYVWGIVDAHPQNIAGAPAAGTGIGTNSTWAYEYLAAGAEHDKTATQRYTKNQYESNLPRSLQYKFELPNGRYVVEVYFADPWNCSKNPTLTVNGQAVLENAETGKALQTEPLFVTDGQMTLLFTSSDLCINVAYIRILFAE